MFSILTSHFVCWVTKPDVHILKWCQRAQRCWQRSRYFIVIQIPAQATWTITIKSMNWVRRDFQTLFTLMTDNIICIHDSHTYRIVQLEGILQFLSGILEHSTHDDWHTVRCTARSSTEHVNTLAMSRSRFMVMCVLHFWATSTTQVTVLFPFFSSQRQPKCRI